MYGKLETLARFPLTRCFLQLALKAANPEEGVTR